VSQSQWEGPSLEVDATASAAALGCLRVSAWMRRVGLDSAWRFLPGPGAAFAVARVTLRGGDVEAEVGFAAEDLAVAASDAEAVGELARQAVAAWRSREI
jgi:hypothetical protein